MLCRNRQTEVLSTSPLSSFEIGGIILRSIEAALEEELPSIPREVFNEDYDEYTGVKLIREILDHTILPKVYIRFADFILDPTLPLTLKEGVVVTKRGLYIKSLNMEPDDVCYVKLALTLDKLTDVIEINESQKLTKFELFLEAIELNPENALNYFQLALSLPTAATGTEDLNEMVTLKDKEKTYTKLELFLKAIELDPSLWEAYYQIAHRIPTKEGSVVTRAGKRIHQLKYYLQTLHLNPDHALSYFEVGKLVKKGKDVKFRDQTVWSRQDLFVKSLSLDPSIAMAYYSLGLTMQQLYDTVTLNTAAGELVYTQCDLYLIALKELPTFADIYYQLACGVSKDGSILVSLSSPSTACHFSSSARLEDTESIILNAMPPNSSSSPPRPPLFEPPHPLSTFSFIDRRDLCLFAIEFDRNHARAYDKLASTLNSNSSSNQEEETIQLLNGEVVTKRDLYLLALHSDPTFARGYYNLARKMKWNDEVTLLDKTTVLKTQDLYLKAIEYEPTFVEAYNNLAILLPTRDMKIRLPDGQYASRKELLVLAVHRNPSYLPAYYNLSNSLSAPNESVLLGDGRVVSGKYLQDMGRNSFEFQQLFHQSSTVQMSVWDEG
jgi:tetratricopeptide (TPR) repeat protein